MDITWLGHACFRMRGRDVTVLTDPPDPKSGHAISKTDASVVTISHDHPGHASLKSVGGDPVILRSPGEYGLELKPVMRDLALWGARSLGPPKPEDEMFPGWLVNPIDTILAPLAPPGRFEFRVGDEVASLVDGEVEARAIEDPDVIVEGDPEAVYHMFVDRTLDGVSVEGDRDLLDRLVAAAPRPLAAA